MAHKKSLEKLPDDYEFGQLPYGPKAEAAAQAEQEQVLEEAQSDTPGAPLPLPVEVVAGAYDELTDDVPNFVKYFIAWIPGSLYSDGAAEKLRHEQHWIKELNPAEALAVSHKAQSRNPLAGPINGMAAATMIAECVFYNAGTPETPDFKPLFKPEGVFNPRWQSAEKTPKEKPGIAQRNATAQLFWELLKGVWEINPTLAPLPNVQAAMQSLTGASR